MVWLHALQSHTEHAAALEIDLLALADAPAFYIGSGPEGVSHGTPRSLCVGTIVGRAICSTHEARGGPFKLDVYVRLLVARRFDVVGSAVFGELDGKTVSEEGELAVVEAIVLERVARPDRWLVVIGIPDLDVELGSDAQAAGRRSVYVVILSGTLVLRNVVIDDLQEAIVAAVSLEIKRLRLDAGLVNGLPL